MIKQCVILFAALSVVGAADAGFIACPMNIKSVENGKTIKSNSGSWKVVFTAKNMPVSVPIKASYPGLVKTVVEGKAGLVCYDDDKRPDGSVGRPLYSVEFHYSGNCNDPRIDTSKNGFWCH
jgi:hypothetical protein